MTELDALKQEIENLHALLGEARSRSYRFIRLPESPRCRCLVNLDDVRYMRDWPVGDLWKTVVYFRDGHQKVFDITLDRVDKILSNYGQLPVE